jgi:hypothetical protein
MQISRLQKMQVQNVQIAHIEQKGGIEHLHTKSYSMSLEKYASKSQSIVDICWTNCRSAHSMKHEFHLCSKLALEKIHR